MPHPTERLPKTRTQISRDRRDRLIRAGLCIRCARAPATPGARGGTAMCYGCRQELYERRQAHFASRVDKGLCRDCGRKRRKHKQRCDDCAARLLELRSIRDRALRLETITAYGGQCACCGEREPDCLELDHIYGDGAAERRGGGSTSGTAFYRRLKRQGWPRDRYQLLCRTCNWGKGYKRAECPHQTRRRVMLRCLASLALIY